MLYEVITFNKKSERAPVLSKEEFVNTAFYEKIKFLLVTFLIRITSYNVC